MYRCDGCGKVLDKIEPGTSRCPHCGQRILIKMRSDVVRKVRSR